MKNLHFVLTGLANRGTTLLDPRRASACAVQTLAENGRFGGGVMTELPAR